MLRIADKLDQYIKQRAAAFTSTDGIPALHLRCDNALACIDIQKVQQVAARHGITKINFRSYKTLPTDTK